MYRFLNRVHVVVEDDRFTINMRAMGAALTRELKRRPRRAAKARRAMGRAMEYMRLTKNRVVEASVDRAASTAVCGGILYDVRPVLWVETLVPVCSERVWCGWSVVPHGCPDNASIGEFRTPASRLLRLESPRESGSRSVRRRRAEALNAIANAWRTQS